MRHFVLALHAASSLILWLGTAHAATRPRYGGTLRVSMRSAQTPLEPADPAQSSALEGSNLTSLIFDTLVVVDSRGKIQPALAISWQPEPGGQRWRFKLRHGVTFHDGTVVTADQVAASLRVANPSWKVLPAGDDILIERDSPAPGLPTELAKSRNAIAKRGGTNSLGTGPFGVGEWQPGKKLMLAANNDYWAGRPFVDSIEITMGQAFREQAISLDLGKADLIELAPEQARRALGDGRRTETSAPSELMALVFTRDLRSTDEGHSREALALSLDRTALSNVLLQGGGEPAGGLLPNWMSGYAFLFPTNADLTAARQARGGAQQVSAWSVGYDANDPLARLVAERIVLNARDAGLTLQLTTSNNPDIRLLKLPISTLDARLALAALADSLHMTQPKLAANSSEELYAAEGALLASHQVIPLVHLRASYGMSARINNWGASPNGSWHLSDVWLAEK